VASESAGAAGLWRGLAAAALLGTERQPPPLPETDTGLDQLLRQLDPADREGALLGAAAAAGLYRRAGLAPTVEAEHGAPACPPEARPPCGEGASARLAALLDGQHDGLLPEWLAAVAAAGRRAPPRSLPDLLELGRKSAGLRQGIAAVLGERGRWLAGQNPDWSWAAAGEDESLWQSGDRDARRELLRRLRASDRERARTLLESTWADETPDDRFAFLELLRDGLGMADEPFLEAALDDRRKEVRQGAADLLGHLPGSRLVERMTERVGALLRLSREGGGLLKLVRGGPRLEASLPSACDRAMLRDGVAPKPPAGIGERGWWLLQMLRLVPPRVWSERLAMPPHELIAAAARGESGQLLTTGWVQAAARHGDAAWARALASAEPAHRDLPALVGALPPDERERIVLAELRASRSVEVRLVQMLDRCDHAWSIELGRAVLDMLIGHIRSASAYTDASGWLLGIVRHLGRRMPVALADEAAAAPWPTGTGQWSYWQRSVEAFLSLLRLRREMLEEIGR
jgi:hypothetical protein